MTNRQWGCLKPCCCPPAWWWRIAGLAEAYVDAASGYRDVLARMPASDDRRESTVERLAASLYRRAEVIAAGGDALGAAMQFARVVEETPNASFRRQAQFDAAQFFMDAGNTSANGLLADFRDRFKDDSLAAEVPLKLVSTTSSSRSGSWRRGNSTRCCRKRRNPSARGRCCS